MAMLNAKSEITSKVVEDFHKKRKLFVIVDGDLYYEESPSALSHYNWFSTLSISNFISEDNMIESFTRGYVYNGTVMFYIGLEFEASEHVFRDALHRINDIKEKMNVNSYSKVLIGAIPVKDSIFEPVYKLGTIDEVSKIQNPDKYITTMLHTKM